MFFNILAALEVVPLNQQHELSIYIKQIFSRAVFTIFGNLQIATDRFFANKVVSDYRVLERAKD